MEERGVEEGQVAGRVGGNSICKDPKWRGLWNGQHRKCRRRVGQIIYCPCRLLRSLNFIPKAMGSQKIVLHRGTEQSAFDFRRSTVTMAGVECCSRLGNWESS